MARKGLRSWLNRKQKPVSLRRRPRWARLIIEPLEDRVLPDASLPPAIVVGRTLSSYFTAGIQNNQETITYTVYNEQGSDLTGVLLTDTLEPGVTFQGASQLPDQSGQNLAWSLGTIAGFDRASVTLTVVLGAGLPASPQLDTGAHAFATLNAGAVSNSTPATIVRGENVDPTLLASTPDANTTDPFIQEEAAKLNYDSQQIFNFLHQDIGYNSYFGSVRGARGTLWSFAGNALDVASLGVALMRASGIPAQYEAGMLSQSQAQQLVLSMFPASFQTVGYIQPGTQTSDPANDPQLLSETENHYWFQFDAGSGMQDADSLMASAKIGQTFTTATGTFTEVPDNLREKTEVKLTAEIYNQGAAALGLGDGLSRTVVLDHTFNDVDLVGHPLTIANFVNSSSAGSTIGQTINTYEPYFEVGDEGYPNPAKDAVITGQSYQDVFTNFPFASQVVTGLFADITLSGPQGAAAAYEKTLYDAIGYAARQGNTPVTVSVNAASRPGISPTEMWTLSVLSGLQNSTVGVNTANQLATDITNLGNEVSTGEVTVAGSHFNRILVGQTRAYLMEILSTSDLFTSELANDALVAAYSDRPRLTLVSAAFGSSDQQTTTLSFETDLLRDTIRAVGAPGQASSVPVVFQASRGLLEDQIEGGAFPGASPASGVQVAFRASTSTVFDAAETQGIQRVTLTPGDEARLAALNIDAVAKARITSALEAGLTIIVPSQDVTIGGQTTVAWFQINPQTGETIGVGEDGGHDAILEFVAQNVTLLQNNDVLQEKFGRLAAANKFEFLKFAYYEKYHQVLVAFGVSTQSIKAAKLAALAQFETYADAAIDKVRKDFRNLSHFTSEFYFGMLSLVGDFATSVKSSDPPVTPILLGKPGPLVESSVNTIDLGKPPGISGGTVAGTLATQSVTVLGQLTASWRAITSSSFLVQKLGATSTTVATAAGTVIGSGPVAMLTAAPTSVWISGTGAYQVNGQGNLSFYGPAETSLGVSGTWDSYSATATGTIVITITTDRLTLNGAPLPAGTYMITTSSATLSGSGATTSPNFTGSASITTTGATVNLGAGSGNLSVGGNALDPTRAVTLTGYSGSIAFAAGGGDNTDSATFNGTAANFVQVSSSPATLTTNQNTPITFQVNVQTSFADNYDLLALPPPGWTATMDSNGLVTLTAAPGLQGGTYAIQVIAQSTTNPELVAQTSVNVAITPTQPRIALAVNPDPLFTVPFNGAQVPSAFQAVIDNLGPAGDTYNLTFSNLPTGFNVLNSGASVTVPAGQTGILGIYLQPNGSQLPLPGSKVSFTVTATSMSQPTITKTVTVTFTMPAVEALTISSNPPAVSASPGTAASVTLTIHNVGNVAANSALLANSAPGLTIGGLIGPFSLAVGASTTQTITLTPAASAALNSTLTESITLGPAASQDAVGVVGVSPDPSFAEAGQPVNVSAQVLSGVTAGQQGQASFTITDSTNKVVFTSTPVPVTLSTLTALATVTLGILDTSALAPGEYTIQVTIANSSGQPIAGATGSGSLVIGSPVTASLAVDTSGLALGTNTVTDTLTVGSQTLMGSVQTAGQATSVALLGNLAYVAGADGIDIVDVSNPAGPVDKSNFGSSDVVSGGASFARLDNIGGTYYLLVATTAQVNPANQFTLLVYSLANPVSPSLASKTVIPYLECTDMIVQGNTALVTTTGAPEDSSGNITDQFGTVLSIDVSNPAAPKLAGELFNNRGSPQGGDTNQDGGVIVNSQLAYIATTTSTGAAVESGTGRVLLVNYSNPVSLQVMSEVDIPGTVRVESIAIQGNRALVLGSTGSWRSPTSNVSDFGLTGNVTLTLLDITDPLHPTILGSTLTTQNTFPSLGLSSLFAVHAAGVGNGLFVVSGTLENGLPVILVLNANNPANLVTNTVPTAANTTSLVTMGDRLLSSTGAGLDIYQTSALGSISVTAEVDVPTTGGVAIVSNSFSVQPNQIINGNGFQGLIWDLTLDPGAPSQQITWQTTVNNVQPGQVQHVATGGKVQFVVNGNNQQITLPAANIAGVPETQTVQISLIVRSAQTVAIAQATVAASQGTNTQLATALSELGDAVSLLQGAPTDMTLCARVAFLLGNLKTELSADPGLASFVSQLQPLITDASACDTVDLLTLVPGFFSSLTNSLAVEATQQFTVSLSPGEVDLVPGQGKSFSVQLANTGPDAVTLVLSTGGLPSGVTAALGQTHATLAAGASTTVSLTLNQTLVSSAIFTLDVTAAASVAQQTATAVVAVRPAVADVLGVTVNPIAVQAGSPVSVSAQVFNTANAARNVLAHIDVLNAMATVIGSPPDMTVSLLPGSNAMTLNLGQLSTTGLASGVYSLRVSLRATNGSPLPGQSAQAPFLVDLPITATVSASASTLPPGTSTVTTTITVSDPPLGQASQPPASGGGTPPTTTAASGASPQIADDQVKWIGGATGNWDVAANWLDTTNNTNHIPTATDAVTIGSGATVTSNGADTALSIQVASGSSLDVAFSLILGAPSEIDGGLMLLGGTMTLGGTLTLKGTTQWNSDAFINLNGDTLANQGTMTLGPLASFGQRLMASSDTQGGMLVNSGTITEQAKALLTLNDSVELSNTANGKYVFAGDNSLADEQGACLLVNAGTIEKTAGTGTSSVNVAFSNTGGMLQVDSGTLSLAGGPTNAIGTSTGGTFIVGTNATLDLTGNRIGNTFTGTYTASGGGTVSLSSGVLNIGGGGATFNFPAGMFQWTGGVINVQGNTLTNAGTMTLGSATSNSLETVRSGNGNGFGAPVLPGGQLLNKGTIVEQGPGGVNLYDTVVLNNQSSYRITGDGFITNGGNPFTTFANSGTLVKTGGTGTSQFNQVILNNTGTTEVDSGTLSFVQGYVNNTGTIEANAAVIDINLASTNQSNGDQLNGGTWVARAGGTLAFSDTQFGSPPVRYSQAHLTLDGAGSAITGLPSLAVNAGTITITNGASFSTSAGLDNQGTITLGPAGTFSVGGSYAQDPEGTLELLLGGSPASGQFGTLAVTGSATVGGLLRAELVSGYTPAATDSFTVATSNGSSGQFAAEELAAITTVTFGATVNPNSIVLAAHSATLRTTTTKVTSSFPSGATYGQSITFTATVAPASGSGTPTGAVQFQIDGLNAGSPVTLIGGTALLTTTLNLGQHTIAAIYLSDNAQFADSDDVNSPWSQAVNPGTSTTAPNAALVFTQFASTTGGVSQVNIGYNGSAVTIGTPAPILTNSPGDGLIFLPNGNLLVGGETVREINPTTGAVIATIPINGEHLSLDPSGTKVWTSDQPGPLEEIDLPSLNVVTHNLSGDDSNVVAVAFDSAGNAYYTNNGLLFGASQWSPGTFGQIDLTTFTTKRLISNLGSAHGMAFDSYTGDLILVNAASISQFDPRTLKIVSDREFRGQSFGLDQGSVDGQGHLYVADNGGHLIFVDYSATGLIGDPRDFVSTPFLAATLDDLAPLSGLGSPPPSLTVNHLLPKSGYSVDPASINPAGTLSSSGVIWNSHLPFSGAVTFQLTGQVTNLAPGEVRQISLGTTITTTATSGNVTIPVTIQLAPLTVAGEHIISLTPPDQSVDRSADATYTVALTNPLTTSVTYTLSLHGLTGETVSLASSVIVPAGQTMDVPLIVHVPANAIVGTQVFEVDAHSSTGATDSVEGQLTVLSPVIIPSLAVDVALSPTHAVAGQGDSAHYTLTVTNVGDATDTYSLTSSFPPGFAANFSQSTITVPAGQSNFRDIQLTLTPPVGTTPADYPFSVSVNSTTSPGVTAKVNGTLTVLANGVRVGLSPSSAAPGSSFQMTVTNTGTVSDTFNLALAGPAAVVAKLGTSSVTLAPGGSQTVPITTSSVNFAVPGLLPLTALATSQTNAAVQAGATANLTISTMQAMTAQFSPASQNLPKPGTASFLLLVNNIGNTEDAYTAKITGTTGPLTASLTGLDGQPTQTIPIFRLPGLSTGAILLEAPITAIGQGTITVRVTSLSNTAITKTVTATLVAGLASTTVLSSDHPKGSVFGERVIFTATVSSKTSGAGTPTGKVDFKEGGTDLTPGGVTLSGGLATFSTSSLAVGSHTITTSYGGSSSFLPSSANNDASPLTVSKASSKTTLTSFPLPVFGEQVTFTATVGAVAPGAGTPTGTLTFKEGTQVLAANVPLNSMAKATFSTAPLSVGPHTITAVYSGDGDFLTNTGVFVQPVGKAGTQSSIVSSASTIHLGQTVIFTASVNVVAPGTGMPTGSFKFSDSKVPLGTATMDATGHATFSTSSLAGGSHAISATYLGDANFAASVQSLAIGQFVIRAADTTAMSLSPNPSVYGQPVTFTVTVQATQTGLPFIPGGVVHFNDGGAGAGNVILDATGRGTLSTVALTAGAHTLTAVYFGDRNFTPSNSDMHPVVLTVQKGSPVVTLTSSRSTSVFGQRLVFTATVTPKAPGGGLATGLVMFQDGSTTLGTVSLDSNARQAVFSFATLGVGNHSITATYVGDSNFNAGSSTPAVPESVTKASDTTAVASSSSPALFGQAVTFTAIIRVAPPGAGAPTGMVTFMDGSSVLAAGVTVMQGQATFSTSSLAVGNHVITAAYAGDSDFVASNSSNYGEIVKKAGTTTAVSSSANPASVGQLVTLTATIHVSAPGAGTPTGRVTFQDSATVLGTATLSSTGQATLAISSLSLGNHTITALYAGDTDFLSSSSTSIVETIHSAAMSSAALTRTASSAAEVRGTNLNDAGTNEPQPYALLTVESLLSPPAVDGLFASMTLGDLDSEG
jgi:uncharacterized membrane protein